MHFATRTVSRLPRPWIGQALTAPPSTAVRHSSSSSTDEFVEQLVGKQDKPLKITKVPTPRTSKKKQRKIQAEEPSTWNQLKRASPILRTKILSLPFEIRKIRVPDQLATKKWKEGATSWKNPAVTWPEKPPTASRPRVLNLLRLPRATTPKDIILSIDNAVHEQKVSRGSTIIADILIEPRPDSSDEVDATIVFLHPYGAQTVHFLAVDGHLKIQGVVPEAFLIAPAELSKEDQDRAENVTSPELRKAARPTTLIYN